MRTIATAVSALCLASIGLAQTPPGFSPEVKNKLEIIFGTKAVDTPGASLTRADTARQPTLGTSDTPLLGASYLWMMIDLDVPSNFQNPSAGPRRTNLHALITGFTPSRNQTAITDTTAGWNATAAVAAVYTLAPPTGAGEPVPYRGPAPPAENPPYAHRYVSLLYETPAAFSVARSQVGQNLGFDLAAFVGRVGLGVPVRAGWFNVTG